MHTIITLHYFGLLAGKESGQTSRKSGLRNDEIRFMDQSGTRCLAAFRMLTFYYDDPAITFTRRPIFAENISWFEQDHKGASGASSSSKAVPITDCDYRTRRRVNTIGLFSRPQHCTVSGYSNSPYIKDMDF
jgi:hypothetical protein